MSAEKNRSTRFEFTDDERERLEFIRRKKGERSAASTIRCFIRETSEALGYKTSQASKAEQ